MLKFLVILFASVALLPGQIIHKIDFDRFSRYDPQDWVSFCPVGKVNSVEIDPDYVWFGTASGGILRYHLYEKFWDLPFTTSNGLRSNQILKISHNPATNRLYAVTPAGTDVYNRARGFWEPVSGAAPGQHKPDESAIADFVNFSGSPFPEYYRPTDSELPDFFTRRTFHFRSPQTIIDDLNRSFTLTDRVADRWRRVWIGTDGPYLGSGKTDENFLELINPAPPAVRTRDLLFYGDTLFTGGPAVDQRQHGFGLWDFVSGQWTNFPAGYIPQIYNDELRVVDHLGTSVCFGTDGGLVVLNLDDNAWTSFTGAQGLESDQINDLLPGTDRVWIATSGGLNWYFPGDSHVSEPEDNRLDNARIHQLAFGPDSSEIFLATNRGLYRFDLLNGRFGLVEINSAIPDIGFTALERSGDELWLAGEYGVILYNLVSGKFRSFTGILTASTGSIYDIVQTGNMTWFACERGLLSYDAGRDFWYLATTADGLAANQVYHIDIDGSYLWLSTAGGLTRFHYTAVLP